MVPRQGEQCLVENSSYKGYSPPKCTCNAISRIQVKTYTFLLKCLHAKDENLTHPIPCPDSSSTPLHMHMSSVKNAIYVPLMTIFSKTKAFCFISQNPLDKLRYSLFFYQVPCVFMGSKFLESHRRLRTPSDTFTNFHCWIHMSNREYLVFHSMGVSIPSCYTQHTYFSFPFYFMRL